MVEDEKAHEKAILRLSRTNLDDSSTRRSEDAEHTAAAAAATTGVAAANPNNSTVRTTTIDELGTGTSHTAASTATTGSDVNSTTLGATPVAERQVSSAGSIIPSHGETTTGTLSVGTEQESDPLVQYVHKQQAKPDPDDVAKVLAAQQANRANASASTTMEDMINAKLAARGGGQDHLVAAKLDALDGSASSSKMADFSLTELVMYNAAASASTTTAVPNPNPSPYPSQNAKGGGDKLEDPFEKNLDYASQARRQGAGASPQVGAFRVTGNQSATSPGNPNLDANGNHSNPVDGGSAVVAAAAAATAASMAASNGQTAPVEQASTGVAAGTEPVPLRRQQAPRRRTMPGALAVDGPGISEADPEQPQQPWDDEEVSNGYSNDNDNLDTGSAHGSEFLANARLVEDNEGDHEIFEAKPALEGFAAIIRNRRFKIVAAGFFCVLLAVVVPVAVLVPGKSGDGPVVVINNNTNTAPDLTQCGHRATKQADYRGTMSVTSGNYTCQRWDVQEPHTHRFSAESFPSFGLEENYCRNPDGDARAWCYTTDPEVRFLFCPVPYCNDSSLVTTTKCGTLPEMHDYRGTINVTATGKKCQHWNETFPHKHDWLPENQPFAGLEANYCRNPDGHHQAWCYTQDPLTLYEVCDIPACGAFVDITQSGANGADNTATCYNCTKEECGYARLKQRDYRGTINVTRGGLPCAFWGNPARSSTTHLWNPTDTPHLDLEKNYCRNPSGGENDNFAWCYTDHPTKTWDFCDVPLCEDDFRQMRFCGTMDTFQTDYRGDIRITVTGKPCEKWNSYSDSRKAFHTIEHQPWAGLAGDYCRNPSPGDEHSSAWCYVEDGFWEFCNVPDCKACGTINYRDYRGTEFITRSGKVCQNWESKLPDVTYSERKKFGLEYNLCRNPPHGSNGTRETVWCFTDPETDDWEYCDVPECEKIVEVEGEATCGSRSMGQQDYIGKINVTKSGKPCQPWGSQFPHSHKYTPENYARANLEENYCRQPDDYEETAWCLVDDPDVLWEHCDIPICEDVDKYSFKLEGECGTLSEKQKDYRGNTSVTLSGYTCQEWSSQVPHPHRYSNLSHPFAGLEGNFCRNPDGMEKAWCFTTDPSKLWEYCSIPACVEPDQELNCGSGSVQQADYRGTLSTTESGNTCQRWSSQKPHEHSITDREYPEAGLEDNYCRNPDGEERAWCYTTNKKKRWEFCDVPYCGELLDAVTYDQCGLSYLGQSNYRGKVNTTVGGLTCQRWDSQSPHAHRNTPGSIDGAGLEENYCRNPYDEDRAWCYTMDPDVRWDYCDIPNCEEHPSYCGTDYLAYSDYRGSISTTISGRTCQPWDSQTPHEHSNTVANRPDAGLESNYCRNPDGEPRAWCYTADADARWEFCNIPSCKVEGQGKDAGKAEECGSEVVKQADYRGTVSETESGRQCQRWDSQFPHAHSQIESHPDAGLEENYCRNPDGEPRAWCYTVDAEERWEFCDIPTCASDDLAIPPDLPVDCGSAEVKQADYRGTASETESGLQCQRWDSQSPHAHGQDVANPGLGLEENYCRNPDGEPRAWCYTEDAEKRWEFCDIPTCARDDPARDDLPVTCGSEALGQSDYRGTLAITYSGLECQRWDVQFPHEHMMMQDYPDAGLEENYCRNPDGESRAWCYTTATGKRWDFCDIPMC